MFAEENHALPSDRIRREVPDLTAHDLKRVLFVRLGAIGDVVNALIVATALKEASPDTHIGWVVHDLARPLVEGHPAVDRVHLWKRGGGFGGVRKIVRQLRAERYDSAIDIQRIAKSAFLARASGAKRVIGYDRSRTKEQSWLLTKERIAPGDGGAHMVEQYLDMARYLGFSGEAKRELPPAPQAEERVAQWFEHFDEAPIQINLGASKPANRWEPERFGELTARILTELKRPVFLSGAPNERHLADQVLAIAGESKLLLNLVGETSLPELWSASRRASLFVGCDTGPMHLAAAVETPVLALFGPATPRRTGPHGSQHRVLSTSPPCAPCGLKHCNQPRHACMEDLNVEQVFEAIRA